MSTCTVHSTHLTPDFLFWSMSCLVCPLRLIYSARAASPVLHWQSHQFRKCSPGWRNRSHTHTHTINSSIELSIQELFSFSRRSALWRWTLLLLFSSTTLSLCFIWGSLQGNFPSLCSFCFLLPALFSISVLESLSGRVNGWWWLSANEVAGIDASTARPH